MGIRTWAHNRMTKKAVAARARGDRVYVHQIANEGAGSLRLWINKIESVGWRFDSQTQAVGTGVHKGKAVWMLTFTRADGADGMERLP